MLGFYNYTVYMTYAGLLSAVTGIFFAFGGKSTAALCCLLFSGLCDLFDGKIARTKKDRTVDEKNFGIQIDSLSDIVCFGILPACIGFSVGTNAVWQLVISMLFVLAGLIRLAYFNVTEETRQKNTSENRHEYQGVPITASALAVPVLYCFRNVIGTAFPVAYTILLAVLGFCYIAPLRIKKPGKAGAVVMIAIGLIAVALIFTLK